MKLTRLLLAAAICAVLAGCGSPPAPPADEGGGADTPTRVSTPSTTVTDLSTPDISATPSPTESLAEPTATTTAGVVVGPTSAPTQAPPSQIAAPVVVIQSNASLAVTCRNAELIVQGDNSVIAADGTCVGIIIIGHQNRITVAQASGDVRLYGNNNQFTYSGTVTVKDLGSGNVLGRR